MVIDCYPWVLPLKMQPYLPIQGYAAVTQEIFCFLQKEDLYE